MKRAWLWAFAAAVVPILLFAEQPPPIPTIVITNARIFTANPAKPYAEAVAIVDDKISAVGTNDEILAVSKKQTWRIDAGGRRMIPGINDAHVHLGWSATPAFIVDRGQDPTWKQVSAAIANAADEVPEEMWISATVGPKVLLDPAVNAAALDAIAPNRRVILSGFTGHGVMLSKAGREALGITDTITDPPGGWYGRDANGNFNGWLYEYAAYPAQRKFAELAGDDDLIAELQRYANEAMQYGITSVQVMPGIDVERFRTLVEKANLPLRVRRMDFVVDPASTERSRANGLKYVLDGTPIEKNAAVRNAYPGGGNGRLNFTDLAPLIRRANDGKQQILFHAAGDLAVAQALQALSKFPNARRPRIEHGDGMQKDMFELAHKTGVTIVQNPTHFEARDAYPKEGDWFPLASLVAAKIPLALGSDGPMNPYLNIAAATVRRDRPSEALTREQAVTAYTRGSAWAEMRENDKGMIAPGMLADMVILTQDILDTKLKAEQLSDTRSYMTILNGKIYYRAP